MQQHVTGLASGQLVDHFRIVRLLGRGGMGEVYLARDTRLGRKVALKLIRTENRRDRTALDRFLFEARATARFSHPHIVTIFAVGEHEGQPYVALEYLEGRTLRERIDEGRVGAKEALRLGLAIAAALTEAHRHKILHRDLKPENVILARDGRLRVVDFGLAKAAVDPIDKTLVVDRRQRAAAATLLPADDQLVAAPPPADDQLAVTQEGFQTDGAGLRGTPAYMAPEQWQQEPATEATDIWALGTMLHELLVGQRPIDAPSAFALALKVCAPEPVPRVDVPEASAAVADLVARCLEKDPARRPAAPELVAALERLLSGEVPRELGERSPFRGLLPFDERHAELFFGREHEVAAALERLREQPVLPIVGPSGAGKSSFVRAGIVPRLREHGRWTVIAVRPGPTPWRALASSLLHGDERMATGPAPASPTSEQIAALADELAAAPGRLHLALRALGETGGTSVLLIVDQLEEVYTLADDEERRRSFLRAVCGAADDHQESLRVIFTLRDDFLGHVAETAEVREVLSRLMVVRRPGPAALAEILTRPLQALGYGYDDPALVEEMVATMRGEPAGLPLLEFAADLLWQQRDPEQRRLTRAAYQTMGGVGGALATHAEQVLAGLGPAQLRQARSILLRLVTADGTRRTPTPAQALHGLAPDAAAVLERLTSSRLIHMRRAAGADEGEPLLLELVHESLIRSWAQLARWIDESREELATLNQVSQAAELWARRGRRAEETWRGPALAEARRHLARFVDPLPEIVGAFLDAGAARERRWQRRRRRLAAGAFGLLAVIAVASLLVAIVLRQKERAATRERVRAEENEAESLRRGAEAALRRGELPEVRAMVRRTLQLQDSLVARAVWRQVRDAPPRLAIDLGAPIFAVAVAPDDTVAAARSDHAVALVDLQTGAVRVLRGHASTVVAVAFAPLGDTLASGSADGEICVWRRQGAAPRRARPHRDVIWDLRYSRDGARLYSVSADSRLGILELSSLTWRTRQLGCSRCRSLDISPDGRLVAVGTEGPVLVFDRASEKLIRTLSGHRGLVVAVAFNPNGTLLASQSQDNTVRLWDVRSGTTVRTLSGQEFSGPSLGFSPNGSQLAIGGLDGSIWVRAVSSGALLDRRAGPAPAMQIATDTRGGFFVTGNYQDGKLPVRAWRGPDLHAQDPAGAATSVAFHPRGRRLAAAFFDGSIRLLDRQTGAQQLVLVGHVGAAQAVAFSSDGETMASSGVDTTVRLWSVSSGVQRLALLGHTRPVFDVDFSPDGRLLASASADGTVRVWDATDGHLVRLAKHTGRFVSVTFSPDGRLLASASLDGTVRIWTTVSGAEATLLRSQGGAQGLAFSPDGSHMVTSHLNGDVRLWELSSRTSQVVGKQENVGYKLAFHPDGRRVGVPSKGLARIWDLATGRHLDLPRFTSLDINALRFSPDGQDVATASDDGTVRLFDAQTGKPIWRAPLLVPSPPTLFSHRGWLALDPSPAGSPSPAASPARPSRTAWERAVAERAWRASVDPSSAVACLATQRGVLELWDLRADRRLRSQQLGELQELIAVPGGCVVRDRQAARFVVAVGAPRPIATGVSGLTWDHGELLAAGGGLVRALTLDGALHASWPVERSATTARRAAGWLVVGHGDGRLKRLPLTPQAEQRPFSPEAHKVSPVLHLVEGPAATIAVGQQDGSVSLYSLRSGARLESWQLSGPATHLLVRGHRLYAASAIGDHVVIDLSSYQRDYCELLREIWRRVPAEWEAGRPVPTPPPVGHRCAVDRDRRPAAAAGSAL